MDKFKFFLEDENGKKEEYDVVYTMHSDITGKDYIIYTDGTKDNEGNLELLAGVYDKNNPEISLSAIESDTEWAIVEELLNQKLDETNEDDE